MIKQMLKTLFTATFLLAVPTIGYAASAGPDVGYSGAPGEQNCASCHPSGNAFGSLKVTFVNGLFYTPGAKQRLMVTIADTSKLQWGFQLTARQANAAGTQAGVFTPTGDGYTQTVCGESGFDATKEQFGVSPCPSSRPLQWIEHTSLGNFAGQPRTATWQFDWTPPSSNVGGITIYLAGVSSASNGDNVYTQRYTLTVPAANQPNILTGGVVNGAGFQGTISPNAWVTINGTNLANSTRTWGSSDFTNGQLPTQLDGVGVTIDGKAAYVEYVSPTQLNVLAPNTISNAAGLVVQVVNNSLSSNPGTITGQTTSPAFFEWSNKYAVTTRQDFSLVAPPNLFGSGSTTTPARPGDIVILWATGLGAVSPAPPVGQLTPSSQLYSVVNLPVVTVGGSGAQVIGAALAPGYAGLYQIAIQVPMGVPDGDQPVMVQANGNQSPTGVFLTVRAASN